MIRYEVYHPDGTLKERVEVERLQDGTAWLRRYDAADALIEEREATDRERRGLRTQERAEYEANLRQSARNMIAILKAQREESQVILNRDAANIAEVNQALDMLTHHTRALQIATGDLIRLVVRALEDAPES